MIISVGYRVNSKRGTQFRIWATRVLREHLTRGLTINRQRLEANAREIEVALEMVRRTIASSQLTADMGRGIVEVITRSTDIGSKGSSMRPQRRYICASSFNVETVSSVKNVHLIHSRCRECILIYVSMLFPKLNITAHHSQLCVNISSMSPVHFAS